MISTPYIVLDRKLGCKKERRCPVSFFELDDLLEKDTLGRLVRKDDIWDF